MTAAALALFIASLAVLAARAAGAGFAWAWARRAPADGLHAWAPLASRAAWAIPLLGLTTALFAFVPSIPWTWLGGACACETYGGLHVCPLHPGPALTLLGPVALLAGVVLAPAMRRVVLLGLALRDVARLTADAPEVRGVGQLDHGGAPVVFAAGLLRPRLFADATWWSALGVRDRAVIEAHERAHLAAGDTRARVALDVVLAAFAPKVREAVLEDWMIAAELRADAAAARADGDPLFVADVLCRYARAGGPGLSLPFGRRALVVRVEALVSERAAPEIGLRRGVALGALGAALGAGHALHRLLELGLSSLI
jgi:hypothetical protein